MHEEVLNPQQLKLKSLLQKLSSDFALIGGTSIALQIGHRQSVDFDLVSFNKVNLGEIQNKIRENYQINSVLVDHENELSLVVSEVKFTLLNYPFSLNFEAEWQNIIKMPDILTLAAMKSYALGRRAKWKDYVDLYFVFQNHTLADVVNKAKNIYGNEFNEKLFREQLNYFEDIDYSEKVNFMPGFEIPDNEIQSTLKEISLQK